MNNLYDKASKATCALIDVISTIVATNYCQNKEEFNLNIAFTGHTESLNVGRRFQPN